MKKPLFALAFLLPGAALLTLGILTLRPRVAEAACAGGSGYCANGDFSGDYSFHGGAPGVVNFVGVMHAAGDGTLTGTETIAIQDGESVDTGSLCLSGTYSINGDGTGTMSITTKIAPACTETNAVTSIAFVLENSGNAFHTINVDGNIVIGADGRRQ